MKQFFDGGMLGKGGEDDEGSEEASGWDFRRARYLDLFSRIGFLLAGGNGISGFHVPRQLH